MENEIFDILKNLLAEADKHYIHNSKYSIEENEMITRKWLLNLYVDQIMSLWKNQKNQKQMENTKNS